MRLVLWGFVDFDVWWALGTRSCGFVGFALVSNWLCGVVMFLVFLGLL